MEELKWLSNWFHNNCDGDWEHTYGVKIQTLDNPGWSFTAALTETDQEGELYAFKKIENDNDWFDIKSDGITFTAFGDPLKLPFLIDQFKIFVEQAS